MLELLGLDDDATHLYRFLLRVSEFSADDLAAHLRQSPEIVAATVGTLKRLGLVRAAAEDSRVLRAVSPEIALSALLDDQEAELLSRHREINRAKTTIKILIAEHTEHRLRRAQGLVEVLDGADETCDRMHELTMKARHVLAFAGPAYDPDDLEHSLSVAAAALKRGVSLRRVQLDSARNQAGARSYAQRLAELGAEIRTIPILPASATIFDREIAILPLDPDGQPNAAVVIRAKGVLNVLLEQFDQAWAMATPLGTGLSTTKNNDLLSPIEHAALTMLARGLTDEAVARKMGVSLRTVRRVMARLMTNLGTRSRLEVGVLAAKRGWI